MSDLLNSASLVMIPSGYAEDKVYSVVPSDGSGDLSFTRASNGTRVNSAGLVEVCPWNLLEYSEQFDNSAWTKFNASITPNDATAPNGTLTADKVVFSGASHYFYQQISFVGQATASIYIKGTAGQTISIDNTQTITEPLITLTGEWQRIVLTSTTTGASVQGLAISTYQSATARTIYVWGGQINIGSTAKPYFPTTDRLNVPRLTYQNGGGGCPSLLLEKQSTNIATYSDDLTNADWIKQQATISANATTSPDGTQNADKLIINNGVSGGYVYQLKSTSSGTVYTGSFYVKAGGVNYTRFYTNISGSYNEAVINLSTGAITNSDFAITPTTQNIGNGWYRVNYTTTSGGGQVVVYVDGGSTSTGGSFTGNGTDGIYLWGAQVEQSSYATSLINTTSSSATRVADACFKTGISSLIGQTEGVMFLDFIFTNINDTQVIMSLHDNANNKRVEIWANASSLYGFVGGSSSFNIASITATSGARYKVAVAYKSGDSAYYVNGSQIGTNSTTFTIGLTSLIFDYWGGSYPPNAKVNEAIVFPTRLTNAELASLTTI